MYVPVSYTHLSDFLIVSYGTITFQKQLPYGVWAKAVLDDSPIYKVAIILKNAVAKKYYYFILSNRSLRTKPHIRQPVILSFSILLKGNNLVYHVVRTCYLIVKF